MWLIALRSVLAQHSTIRFPTPVRVDEDVARKLEIGGRFRAVLFHGPDSDLVGMHSAALLRRLVGERSLVPPAELAGERHRELLSVVSAPLLGSDFVVVRLRDVPDAAVASLEAALDANWTGMVVAEAQALPPRSRLRVLGEKDGRIALVDVSGGRTMRREVIALLAAREVAVDDDAVTMLASRLGAGRSMSAEVEKLALFVGSGRLDVHAVDEVLGSDRLANGDDLLGALSAGEPAKVSAAVAVLLDEGDSLVGAVRAMSQVFSRLRRIRADLDTGQSFAESIGRLRPPVFPRQAEEIRSTLRRWDRSSLDLACKQILTLERLTKRTGAVGELAFAQIPAFLANLAAQR